MSKTKAHDGSFFIRTMSPTEVLAELQAMQKVAAKIKNKQYGPALTTAIAEFIAAVKSANAGNPEQAERWQARLSPQLKAILMLIHPKQMLYYTILDAS